MRKILCFIIASITIASCSSDSYSTMKEKCKDMDGLFGLKLGKYFNYESSGLKEIGYILCDSVASHDIAFEIVDDYCTKERNIENWKCLTVSNGDSRLVLELYNDTLVAINAKGWESIKKEISKYGNGSSYDDFFENKRENTPNIYKIRFEESMRYYENDNVVIACAKPDELWNNYDITCAFSNMYSRLIDKVSKINKTEYYSKERDSNSDTQKAVRGRGTMDADDKEYWESVNREKALRDRGMDRAADIERKARLEYVQGGGYHSKDGGSQVHFQGSKEQEEQLRQMDEMGW